MNKIELEIIALSHSVTQSNSFAVILSEKKGGRRLPIVIGAFEAQAIAVSLEDVKPQRPLTHDLLKNVFDEMDFQLDQVIINNLVDGIFYALLICRKGDKLFEIDSRSSDALALAVRFNCPIYVYDFILDSAGISVEGEEGITEEEETEEETVEAMIAETTSTMDYDDFTDEELNTMLKKAIDNEDYEKAASIRDHLKKRK